MTLRGNGDYVPPDTSSFTSVWQAIVKIDLPSCIVIQRLGIVHKDGLPFNDPEASYPDQRKDHHMRNTYVKNGDFTENFAHWEPADFKPIFKTYGQSIQLSAGESITQALPDLPGRTLRIEFDVRSAAADTPMFTVSVGGIDEEGTVHVSPVPGSATDKWQRVSTRMYFQSPMTQCVLTVSAADTGSVLFSRFSLFDEQAA